jgi:hypothetical protein
MMERSLAAQRFWRDLIASCTRAGDGDLDTDDMAYVVLELGLGLLALDASHEQLLAYLNVLRTDLEENNLAAVNAALSVHGASGFGEQRSWSWAGALSRYGDAHPWWNERQLAQLTELRCFTPSRRFDFIE